VIAEVCTVGRFVSVYNMSPCQDEDIGGHMIQQNVNGRPVTLFRFPPRTILKAGELTTVWSLCAAVAHDPPYNFVWKGRYKWESGKTALTILNKPNGKAISWTSIVNPPSTNVTSSNNEINTAHSYNFKSSNTQTLADLLDAPEENSIFLSNRLIRCKSAHATINRTRPRDNLPRDNLTKQMNEDMKHPIIDYRQNMSPRGKQFHSRPIYSAPSFKRGPTMQKVS